MVYKDFNRIIASYIIISLVLYCYNYCKQLLVMRYCHGTGAVAIRRMYLGSLQDVARLIVRVEGVRG